MFFYRPTAAQAWDDIYTLETSVTFGLLVRNMHRWGAHLMVITVFLHMARVFYHGAYKPPREFNWVIGVILLTLTLLLSFTGYLLPWDQLALWAVTVGTNMMGYTPVFGDQVRFVLLGGVEIGTDTLLRWYVLHVSDAAVRDRHLHGHPLLAGPQGRRDLGSAVRGLAGRDAGEMVEDTRASAQARAEEARAKAEAAKAAQAGRRPPATTPPPKPSRGLAARSRPICWSGPEGRPGSGGRPSPRPAGAEVGAARRRGSGGGRPTRLVRRTRWRSPVRAGTPSACSPWSSRAPSRT